MKDQLEPISTSNILLQNVTNSYGATIRINCEMGLESFSLGRLISRISFFLLVVLQYIFFTLLNETWKALKYSKFIGQFPQF